MDNHQAIAILDSGVGGITVAKEVIRQLPHEQIIYFGDTARAPYGPRSSAEVVLFTKQIVDFLLQFNPKMIVIACNTATAAAMSDICFQVDIPVLGVIKPGVQAALRATRIGRVGVIGTEGTIRSGAYERTLEEMNPNVSVVSKACPLFVPLVEQGRFRSEEAKTAVCSTLEGISREGIDTLILGCTHYPFLAALIQECVGPEVALISSADQTVKDIIDQLRESGQLALPRRPSQESSAHRFYCSGDLATFRRIVQEWLDEEIPEIPLVQQVPSFAKSSVKGEEKDEYNRHFETFRIFGNAP